MSVEEFTHANRTIRIELDTDPMNPRKDWDPVTTIYHWHYRYDFGAKISPMDEKDFRSFLQEQGEEVLALSPLYLMDHSGLSLSVKPFGCPWDSGQVGWVVITKSRAAELGFVDHVEADWIRILQAEIKEYDQYLRGEVYGFQVLGLDGDELESCWGFYDLEDCREQAKAAAEHTEDPAIQRQVEELESRATLAGGPIHT